MTKKSISYKTKRLTTSGVMLALATALSLVCEFIPFLNLPFGGTITIASMVPIILLSYMYGVKWGALSSFAYSLIKVFMSFIMGSTVKALFTPADDSYMGIRNAIFIILLDYIIAFTILCAGGVFRNKFKNKVTSIIVGIVFALSLSYFAHIVSGCIFYGAWAEWFFETIGALWVTESFTGGLLVVIYSTVYNGCFMIPEIIISVLAGIAVSRLPDVKKQS